MNYDFGEAYFEYFESMSEANESQNSYSVEQADICQYQSYSHSDDMFIIIKSTINTDASIFVFSRNTRQHTSYSGSAG
jgi:hypothetical protein